MEIKEIVHLKDPEQAGQTHFALLLDDESRKKIVKDKLLFEFSSIFKDKLILSFKIGYGGIYLL
jgi:hypothetical protein